LDAERKECANIKLKEWENLSSGEVVPLVEAVGQTSEKFRTGQSWEWKDSKKRKKQRPGFAEENHKISLTVGS